MTFEQSKSLLAKAESEFIAAKSEVQAATLAVAAAVDTLRSGAATATPERLGVLEAEVAQAKSRRAMADINQRRADTAHREAKERAARLAPHAEVLAKLDRAVMAVVKGEAALSILALDLHAQAANAVRELRKQVEAAGAVYGTLPMEVRNLDLSAPQTAAQTFGNADPDSVRLLALLSDVLLRRFPGERITPAAPRR